MSEKVIFYESMKDGCKYFVCPLIFSTILFLLMLSLTINEYLLQSLELYECIVIIIFFGLVSLISLFAFCYCVCYKIFLYEDRGEIKSIFSKKILNTLILAVYQQKNILKNQIGI